MSRSNPSEDVNLVNPAQRFLEWNGKSGGFKYYDKTEKKNVDVPLPFTFIPLCTMVTLKGYNQKKDIGYWSNEVKDITKDKFVIKGKHNASGSIDTHFEGFYKDLKDQLELNKINYTQSLYIGYKDEKGVLQLGNLQIKTSALGPWINFCKLNKIMEIGVQVKSFTNEKNGSVDFVAPVYTAIKVSDETNKDAAALDVKLQEYLSAYLERNKTSNEAPKSEVKAADVQSEAKHQVQQEENQWTKGIDASTFNTGDDENADLPF